MAARRLPDEPGGQSAREGECAEEGEAPVLRLHARGADAVVPLLGCALIGCRGFGRLAVADGGGVGTWEVSSFSLMSGPAPPPWLSPAFMVWARTVAPWLTAWRAFHRGGPFRLGGCAGRRGTASGCSRRGGGCRPAGDRAAGCGESGTGAGAEIGLDRLAPLGGRLAQGRKDGVRRASRRRLADSGHAARNSACNRSCRTSRGCRRWWHPPAI